jgi:hypothetical protein
MNTHLSMAMRPFEMGVGLGYVSHGEAITVVSSSEFSEALPQGMTNVANSSRVERRGKAAGRDGNLVSCSH